MVHFYKNRWIYKCADEKFVNPDGIEVADLLEEQKRLAPTTILSPLSLKFAWILPGERLLYLDGGENGGFFYYSEEHKKGWVRRLQGAELVCDRGV